MTRHIGLAGECARALDVGELRSRKTNSPPARCSRYRRSRWRRGRIVRATDEHDEASRRDGPWKGETHRRCNWPLGQDGRNGNVFLLVTAIRTDAQRKAAPRASWTSRWTVQGAGVGLSTKKTAGRTLGLRRGCTAAV